MIKVQHEVAAHTCSLWTRFACCDHNWSHFGCSIRASEGSEEDIVLSQTCQARCGINDSVATPHGSYLHEYATVPMIGIV